MNYIKPNSLFEVYYFYYLTPKDLLVNKRFNLKALTLLLEMILLKYKQSIIQPGEMVGIIAGQSTGEPTTQLTLNTFHNSGISSKSNVTRGVPRIEELLRLTSSPKGPSLTIHLKTLEETDESKASKYANMIEYTKLINVIKSVQICFEPHTRSTSIQEDKVFLEQFYEFEDMISECDKTIGNDIDSKNFSKWIIRLEMDAEILLEKNISMDDIHYAIRHSHLGSKVSCVFSDFNHDKLIFRIRMLEDKKKNVKSLDESDNIYLLKQFQDILLNTIVLRGINNIEKVMTRKLKNMVVLDDGKYVKRDCWVLDTTGTNLLSVLGLDYIDSTRTFSNDVREVFDVLGLEAARQILCNEFTEVMETSDAYINYHHLGLLCDRMTTNKDMVPIFRTGLLKDNIGPIAKATFEVHTEVLLDAARHADFDHMRGVSSAVMCGQYGNYGTGSFSIVLDTKEMVKLAEANIQEGYDIEKMLDISIDNGECSKSKIEIKNNIVNINTKQVDLCDDDYDIGI
jgi:DNA-directed RNA polymerase II subunit RPB1